MGKRIYVGNLPWSITKKRLEELFSSFGDIEDALVIANKYTGRSRGFGFVTFKEDSAAEEAIQKMDRQDVEGRNIVVKEAKPMEEKRESREEGAEEENGEEEIKEKPKRGRKKKAEEKKE